VSTFPKIPKRFSVIDKTNWDEYHYIGPGDECFYIWERMSQLWKAGERPDYNKYPTNGFISNLQIPVSCKTDNPFRYKHKVDAIKFAAEALGQLLPKEWRDVGTFIPIPPSRVKDDPDHDARLLRVLKAVRPPLRDVRELVLQSANMDSKQKGLRPEERAKNYFIDEGVSTPEPEAIFLVDDVLTTGSHFKALKTILNGRFPQPVIYGLFLARAVRPPQDGETLSLGDLLG
jgi:hypothetical protein